MSRPLARRALFRSAAITCLVAGLTACMAGPDYRRPRVRVPAHWSSSAQDIRPSHPVPEAWWKLYGDPELDALIRRALAANLNLQRADRRMLEARAMLESTRSPLRPSVGAMASAGRGGASRHAPGVSPFPQGGDFGSGTSAHNLFQTGFDASWELDLFGGNRRAVEASRADLQSAAFQRQDVALSLSAEIARTYVDLRRDQALLKLSRDIVDNRRDALALVRARYTGGLATDLDLSQAEDRLHEAEAAVPTWRVQGDRAMHRLGILLGEAPGALATELAEVPPLPLTVPPVTPGLPSDLLRRRPDIRSAERQVAAATARIGVATARLYPHVSLGSSLGLASFASSQFFDPQSTIWSVGASLTWPIFDGGRLRAQIRIRDLQAQEALLAYRQTILSALADVENALSALQAGQVRDRAMQARLDARRKSYQQTRALYAGGMTDFRDVLDQQQRVLLAKGDLIRDTTAEWTNLFALCKALGGGWGAPSPARPGHGAP